MRHTMIRSLDVRCSCARAGFYSTPALPTGRPTTKQSVPCATEQTVKGDTPAGKKMGVHDLPLLKYRRERRRSDRVYHQGQKQDACLRWKTERC